MDEKVIKVMNEQNKRIEHDRIEVLGRLGLAQKEYLWHGDVSDKINYYTENIPSGGVMYYTWKSVANVSDEELSELISKARKAQEYEHIAASLNEETSENSTSYAKSFKTKGTVLSIALAIIAIIAAVMVGGSGGIALSLTIILFALVFIYFIMAQSNMLIRLAQIESRLEDLLNK